MLWGEGQKINVWDQDQVVKFHEMVTVARRKKLLRLYEIQRGRCCYCGTPTIIPNEPSEWRSPKRATLEHIRGLGYGGTDNWHNLVMACQTCNNIRGGFQGMSAMDFYALRSNPKRWSEHVLKQQKVKTEQRMGKLDIMSVNLAILFHLIPETRGYVDQILDELEVVR